MTFAELPEDAADHIGLMLVRLELASLAQTRIGVDGDAVAIAQAPCRTSVGNASLKAPVRHLGDALQVHCVHRALHADVEFFDAALGDGVDLDAVELAHREEVRRQLLASVEAVKPLGQDDVYEAALHGLQHLLVSGALALGPGDGGVFEDLQNLPFLSLGERGAVRDLVARGVHILQVSRKPCVDHGAAGIGA
nr:hypothetical protein [Roseivivax lentus]